MSYDEKIVTVVPFKGNEYLAKDFDRLNREWIEKLFKMEQPDEEMLANPELILNNGGYICFALFNNRAVGTGALVLGKDNVFEVVKMGVEEASRGQGVGDKLLTNLLDYGKSQGCTQFRIETSSTLPGAIYLYKKHGFVDDVLAYAAGSAHGYDRADTYLRLDIATH